MTVSCDTALSYRHSLVCLKAAECVQCRSVLQISERESLEGQPAARQPCRSERQYEVILYRKHEYSMLSGPSNRPDHNLYLSVQRPTAHY